VLVAERSNIQMSLLTMTAIMMLALLFIVFVEAEQPEGWRMVDRFYGFRYEISPSGSSVGGDFKGLEQAVQEQADAFACFGWIQPTLRGSVVGEARCTKDRGVKFQSWLETKVPGSRFDVLVYEDTKIRLHFSHFKIVDASRDTCFLEAPHACETVSSTTSTSTTADSAAHASGDEL